MKTEISYGDEKYNNNLNTKCSKKDLLLKNAIQNQTSSNNKDNTEL